MTWGTRGRLRREEDGEDGEAKGVKWGGLNTAMRVDRAGMREGVC